MALAPVRRKGERCNSAGRKANARPGGTRMQGRGAAVEVAFRVAQAAADALRRRLRATRPVKTSAPGKSTMPAGSGTGATLIDAR